MELCLILLLSFTALFPSTLSSKNSKYDACSQKLSCGNQHSEIGYPFYDGSTRPDYCGDVKLTCQAIPQITISNREYSVKSINNYNFSLSRTDSWGGSCPNSLENTTIDFSKYEFTSTYQNITFFYDCSSQSDALSSLLLTVSCNLLGGNGVGYYYTQAMVNAHRDSLKNCNSHIYIPIPQSTAEAIDASPNLGTLISAFHAGFELSLAADSVEECNKCINSKGECGYSPEKNKFVCHCEDADYDIQCRVNSPPGKSETGTVVGKFRFFPDVQMNQIAGQPNEQIALIGTSVGIGRVMLGFLILFSCFVFRKCKPAPKNQRIEDMLKNYESLGPRRYTYANITKMTNSFKEKLGEGGYGTVFKGKLQDGRVVAVKVWKQSKGDGHEFANEVVSIGSTSHINVVSLLGFCFEGPKGALIYEFMPNGSLEKFIHRRDVNVNRNSQGLSFQKLFDIAVGIARGLEYLHRDCNTRIVHFDIKPHNILLDAEFTPKISDFGLAKAFKQKESIISISGARGTAGYISPEVFFSSFGGVSHKSDVYSYGMMVLEMVGCTKRPDENVENSSELYFPRWIYKHLERETTFDYARRVLNDEEKELERKMVLTGLWCIQTNPRSRPSMCRVVGMLEGEVELEVPPMPSLASPERQQLSTHDGSDSFLSSDAYAPSNNLEISTYEVSM